MSHATFARPDLTTFCRLDELGLEVTGQRLEPDRAVLACRILDPDQWCRRCGCEGVPRDTVTRELAHEPLGWRPTTLLITVRRYRCTGCGHVWRQDTSQAAEPRAKLSRRGLRWALEGIVCQHLTVARVAEGLGVAWNTANDAVLAEGKRVLIDDEHRFDGVTAIGVDEHVWRHTRRGDKYVTVIIDLTGIRNGVGLARLLDMVEGRSKQAFQTWLADRPKAWRDAVEVVAMDGFTGFKTATTEELPDAVAVMDPFHVVRLAGDALDRCRRRVQQAIHGHRGRKDDPLYRARRTLHTGADLLTDKQHDRLDALFTVDEHAEVEVTWWIYQRMIAALATSTWPTSLATSHSPRRRTTKLRTSTASRSTGPWATLKEPKHGCGTASPTEATTTTARSSCRPGPQKSPPARNGRKHCDARRADADQNGLQTDRPPGTRCSKSRRPSRHASIRTPGCCAHGAWSNAAPSHVSTGIRRHQYLAAPPRKRKCSCLRSSLLLSKSSTDELYTRISMWPSPPDSLTSGSDSQSP